MSVTSGIRWNQIKSRFRLGSGSMGQSCDGTFTSGNLPEYATTGLADGFLTDSGVSLASLVKKYTTSWTSQTSVTVTHNLGTTAVMVQVYDTSSPPLKVEPETCALTGTNVITLTFGAAFSGSVVVIG